MEALEEKEKETGIYSKEVRELIMVRANIAERIFDLEHRDRYGILTSEQIEQKKEDIFGDWLDKHGRKTLSGDVVLKTS